MTDSMLAIISSTEAEDSDGEVGLARDLGGKTLHAPGHRLYRGGDLTDGRRLLVDLELAIGDATLDQPRLVARAGHRLGEDPALLVELPSLSFTVPARPRSSATSQSSLSAMLPSSPPPASTLATLRSPPPTVSKAATRRPRGIVMERTIIMERTKTETSTAADTMVRALAAAAAFFPPSAARAVEPCR